MKKYLVLAWLLLPLPVVVVHYGRGQEWLALDRAHDLVGRAAAAENAGDWKLADECYRDAAASSGLVDPGVKMRLELARVRMRFREGDAMAAIGGADKLLDDAGMAAMPAAFRREARDLAGRIHYYAAWVLRLEGAKRELWMEEAELARQNFRLLAEDKSAPATGAEDRRQRENLEAAVQLQRLSFTELMARPIPKEGRGMSNGGLSEKMAKRRAQRGKKPGPGDKGPPGKDGGLKRYEPGMGS